MSGKEETPLAQLATCNLRLAQLSPTPLFNFRV